MTLNEKIETNYTNIAKRFSERFSAGRVITDPFLQGTSVDSRRGLTLFARPSPETVSAVTELIAKIAPSLGEQYTHPETDLHTTVLSVIPGSATYFEERDIIEPSIEATEHAIHSYGCDFKIHYRGVIASSDSLIVKGYPDGNTLQRLREAIISELANRGIEQRLQRRYLTIAAHMTVVRFISQPHSLTALQQSLQAAASVSLGTTHVTQLELAENDWYMRAPTLVEKGTYGLRR